MARKRGIYRVGTVYYGRWTENGRLVRRALSTDYSAACDMLDDLRQAATLVRNGCVPRDAQWTTIRDAYLRASRQENRPSTVASYEADLRRFETFAKPTAVSDITRDVAREYRDKRIADGRGARTVNRELGAVSTLLNWGVKEGRIPANPLATLGRLTEDRPRKVRRALEPAELTAILRESPERLLPAWLLLATTGIRRGELIALKFSDVDFERDLLTIRAEVAKSKKARTIPLRPEVVGMLRHLRDTAPQRTANYRTKHDVDHDYVIVNEAGCRYRHAGNLLRSFYVVCKVAGIADAVPHGAIDLHSLRGTFATMAIEAGADPRNVQAILGHSTLQMTMAVYSKARHAAAAAAVAALPDLLPRREVVTDNEVSRVEKALT